MGTPNPLKLEAEFLSTMGSVLLDLERYGIAVLIRDQTGAIRRGDPRTVRIINDDPRNRMALDIARRIGDDTAIARDRLARLRQGQVGTWTESDPGLD